MDPGLVALSDPSPGLPRARGDGPVADALKVMAVPASPRTRGWTLEGSARMTDGIGFPAHAGMDPIQETSRNQPTRLPRARGDGPGMRKGIEHGEMASPRTRGWTLDASVFHLELRGFPAHAGMDRSRCRLGRQRDGLPRARGDGPLSGGVTSWMAGASPRTRGWTPVFPSVAVSRSGFPAHAGMDPGTGATPPMPPGLPRARGDGPVSVPPAAKVSAASPRTRGWTPGRVPGVQPA